MALIFCFDNIILFTMVPLLMALARPQRMSVPAIALEVVRRVALHPLIVASALASLPPRCTFMHRSRSTG